LCYTDNRLDGFPLATPFRENRHLTFSEFQKSEAVYQESEEFFTFNQNRCSVSLDQESLSPDRNSEGPTILLLFYGKGTTMKTLKISKLIGISMLFLVGLGACNSKPGPAENAGKSIDQTADKAGKNISQAADKLGKNIDSQGKKAGVAIDDAVITTKVKSAIFAEPGLKSMQINVGTVKGVVTLRGSVDSLPNSERAKTLARAVAGVKEVKNRLVVK